MPEVRTTSASLDVNELINEQRVGAYSIVFLVIATLAMIADGYDIAAIGFVVPELAKQWQIAPAAMAPALGAGVIGLLVGAPIFGYVGDRFGRRSAIISSLIVVGVFTLITMWAASLPQLIGLRFITGVGLGGLIPNIIALAAEVAPKRLRGVFIIIVNFGVPAGFVLPGKVTAMFVPTYGWPVLMFVGAVIPLVIAVLAYFLVQESIGYLVSRGDRDAEVRKQIKALRPELAIGPETRLVSSVKVSGTGSPRSPAKLFAGGLAFITPIFWIALAANQFTNFFMLGWLPTLLQQGGLTTAQAGNMAAMYALGGIVGGLLLLFLVDKLGALPMVILFLVAAPLVGSIGQVAPETIGAIIAAAGFCITGNQFASSAVVGMIYPTAIRSMGAGWAQAFGRLGSLLAQIAGGLLLAKQLPAQQIYLAPAISLVIGAVAILLFVIFCRRRFGNFRLDDASAAEKNAAGLALPSENAAAGA
jgi:MFS transporter, AAHS family, 4-hydroxybenzoate transporter